MTTLLPAPVRGRHRVDDVPDDFAGRTASSVSEPSEPALQEHWREGAEVEAMTSNFARDALTPTTTEDTAEVIVVKNFKRALILNA